MSPVRYSTVLGDKSKESRFQLRLELVRYVQKQGLREVARFFRCSRNTVRLWVRRYGVQGFSGLQERTRAPRRIPHKTPLYLEQRVVEAIRRTLRGRGLTPGPGSGIRRSWIRGR